MIQPRPANFLGKMAQAENIKSSRQRREFLGQENERLSRARELTGRAMGGDQEALTELPSVDIDQYSKAISALSEQEKRQAAKELKNVERIVLAYKGAKNPLEAQANIQSLVSNGLLTSDAAKAAMEIDPNEIPSLERQVIGLKGLLTMEEKQETRAHEIEKQKALYDRKGRLKQKEYGLKKDLESYKSTLSDDDYGSIHDKLVAEGYERGTPEYQQRAKELNTKVAADKKSQSYLKARDEGYKEGTPEFYERVKELNTTPGRRSQSYLKAKDEGYIEGSPEFYARVKELNSDPEKRSQSYLKAKDEGYREGTPEFFERVKQLNEKGGQEINVYTGDNVPLTRTQQNKVQNDLVEAQKSIADLGRVGSTMADEYLTYYGRIKGGVGKVLDKFGVEDSSAVQFQAKKSEFDQNVGQFFDQYRSEITGAAASEAEMKRLINNLFNGEMGPTEFKARFNAQVRKVQDQIKASRKLLNEGLYTGSPILEHSQYGEIYEEDIQKTMQETGMTREEVMERLVE